MDHCPPSSLILEKLPPGSDSMERLVRQFVPRSVFARRFGIFGASMLPLGSIHGGKMPVGIKVACRIDGELREARYGETTHREICQREAIPGSVIVEGFSLPNDQVEQPAPEKTL
jgi:hypothetical protein